MEETRYEIDIVFETIPDQTTFNSGAVTWVEVRAQLTEKILKLTSELVKQGIKKVEVGSIGWFYRRNRTQGRFLTLNTMFVARLLKRR